MTTGHAGSLSTIHANDTRDAVSRLEMLVGMSGCDLPMWVVHRMVGSAIDIVVQCARLAGGGRKVTRISEVTGVENEVISMHDIFEFHQTGLGENRAPVGVFRTTGIRPRCLDKLHSAGFPLPPELFYPRVLENNRLDEIAPLGGRV
jgi:pilus assembly protein CpaF